MAQPAQPETPVVKPVATSTSSASKKSTKMPLILVVLVLLVAVGGGLAYMMMGSQKQNQQVVAKKEVNALTIYHWWTSPGEASAMAALVGDYSKQYPDVAIMPAPVSGNSNDFHKVLQPMVLNGEAPDSFQGHPGYEIKPYYDSNTLDTVDDIWKSENLEAVIPKTIQDISKFKGNYYSIPLGVHRNNVVWYNKSVLDKAGVNAADLKDWDTFFAACDKLKAAGVQYPIQMGETWTEMHVFEDIIASQGPQLYQDWANGKVTSATDPRMVKAFEIFKKYLSYTNTDSAKTHWDEAVNRVIKGQSAFNVMGDWANGEFKIVGMKYNKDYGTFVVPGTSGIYVLTVDNFVQPRGTTHPTNSEKWLKVVASKEGQDAFNPKKGSISPRSDSNITLYDDYQKSAITDFKAAKYYLPSRGTSMPVSYGSGMDGIINTFVSDKDVTKAVKAFAALANSSQKDFITAWTFAQ